MAQSFFDGALSAATVVASIVVGAAAMASAIVLLMLQPRFRYPDCDPLGDTKDGHGNKPPGIPAAVAASYAICTPTWKEHLACRE